MSPDAGADGSRRSMLSWLPGETLRRAQLDERVEWELRSELVRRLVREKPFAEVAHVVLAAVICTMVWNDIGGSLAAAWLGAVALAALGRAWVRERLARRGGPIGEQLRRIRVSVFLLAAAWGLGGIAAAPHLPDTHVLLLMVVIAGLVAVAPMSLVADPRAFWALVATLLISLAIILLLADMGGVASGALIIELLYAGSVGRYYQKAHEQYVDALRTSKRLEFTQQEAHRERTFLDALITSAPMAIAAVSRHGRVLGVNPAFEKTFGHVNEFVIGRELDALIVPEDAREEAQALERRVAEGQAVQAEVERIRSDGQRLWVRLAAAPVQGIPQGGVFVLYQDVTALRHAEAARREAEAQYRRLVETASDLVFQVDLDGRWTFLNEAAREIYGRHPEDMLGQAFAEVVHPDHVERDLEMHEALLAGEEVTDHETVHLDVHRTPRTLSFSVSPMLGPDGDVIGTHGIARDITGRAEAREALRRARDAAEHATVMKSSFLANMSHEIRTPLNGVLGMIELLLDSKLSKTQQRQAELIRSSADSLLHIINDILDYSKIEAGRLELEETDFNVAGLIEELVQLYHPKAAERGIQLLADLDRGVPSALRGDPVRLRQVLVNLVSNGLKFTEEGEVAVIMRLLDARDGAASVRFSVRDTGVGISEEAQKRIFAEFEQADPSVSRRYGGTGLGLAICRNLVQLMGGELTVESIEDRGSEFAFDVTLPVGVGRPAPAPDPGRERGAAPVRRRVLVAEDNPVNQEVARQMLERRGHDVTIVANGRLAMEAVAAGPPFDVVLMDIQMPEMDGLSATMAIRAMEEVGTVPIYAVSANTSGVERERCLDAGMDGYLTKPFKADDLFHLVEEGREPARGRRRSVAVPVDLDDFRAQLDAAGVEGAMGGMLDLFLEDAPARFRDVERAVAARDAETIRSAAHAYKSSAGTIRAVRLAAVLRDIEHVAGEGDVPRAVALLETVREVHEETTTYLQAHVRDS